MSIGTKQLVESMQQQMSDLQKLLQARTEEVQYSQGKLASESQLRRTAAEEGAALALRLQLQVAAQAAEAEQLMTQAAHAIKEAAATAAKETAATAAKEAAATSAAHVGHLQDQLNDQDSQLQALSSLLASTKHDGEAAQKTSVANAQQIAFLQQQLDERSAQLNTAHTQVRQEQQAAQVARQTAADVEQQLQSRTSQLQSLETAFAEEKRAAAEMEEAAQKAVSEATQRALDAEAKTAHAMSASECSPWVQCLGLWSRFHLCWPSDCMCRASIRLDSHHALMLQSSQTFQAATQTLQTCPIPYHLLALHIVHGLLTCDMW